MPENCRSETENLPISELVELTFPLIVIDSVGLDFGSASKRFAEPDNSGSEFAMVNLNKKQVMVRVQVKTIYT